ncbi:MAG: hypothetical protein ABH950_05560 [Candidatus Altiarchaeota archaeon]
MKYNVSLVMMGLLLLTIISLISLALYSRMKYDDLSEDYENAIREVNKAAEELNQTLAEAQAKEKLLTTKEQILVDYLDELNLSKERESSLGVHFTELRGEKDILTANLSETRERLGELNDEFEKAKTSLDVCEIDFDLCEDQLEDTAENMPAMKGNFSELLEEMNDAWADLTRILDEYEEVDSEATALRKEMVKLENSTDDEEELEDAIDAVKDEINDVETKLSALKRSINDLEENLDSALDRMRLELKWMTS